MTRIVAVTSGKAGAGKTHVSVNLALQCARKGQRVCLFDVDSGQANATRLLDVEPFLTLDEVIQGRSLLRDIVISHQGIDIIPPGFAVSAVTALPVSAVVRLVQEFSALASYDLIILDIGPVASEILSVVVAATEVLLVVTPESTALTEAYALVKHLQRQHYIGQLSVVVNKAESEPQAQRTYEKFREVVRVYQGIDLPLLGSLLYDEQVAEAGENRRPIFLQAATSAAALALTELTNRFVCTSPQPIQHSSTSSFWARVMGIDLPSDSASPTIAPVSQGEDVTALAHKREQDNERVSESASSQRDFDARLARLEAEVAILQQQLRKSPAQHGITSAGNPNSVAYAARPSANGSRSNTAAEAAVCSVRTVQRSTPINALQLRRVVGRMLMKATSASASTDPTPVQISVDQMQIATGNDFSLQPGRYTRISLHCEHIEKPDSFIEEIFSACAISGCKVRHLGSHIGYWVTSGRDGCILLDGDDTDRNCIQVYMAAGGNNIQDTHAYTSDAVPRLRRVVNATWPADVAPLRLLGKYPHQRLLVEKNPGETHEIYRVLRRDRSPLLCAFHRADGETAVGPVRNRHPDSRRV